MITRHDLEEAIAECEGQRNPTANTCLKLAAFYAIRKELFGDDRVPPQVMQSYAPEPIETFDKYGDSDFLDAIQGRGIENVMLIMDELMESMQILQPRIYDSVMRKIGNL